MSKSNDNIDNDEGLKVYDILTNHTYFNRHTIRAFGRDMGLNKTYSGRNDSNDVIATTIAGQVTVQQVNDWLDMRLAPSQASTAPDADEPMIGEAMPDVVNVATGEVVKATCNHDATFTELVRSIVIDVLADTDVIRNAVAAELTRRLS